MDTEHTFEKNCKNCMEYRRGECLGRALCDSFSPTPVHKHGAEQYWPKEMRYKRNYKKTSTHDSEPIYGKVSYSIPTSVKSEPKYIPYPKKHSAKKKTVTNSIHSKKEYATKQVGLRRIYIDENTTSKAIENRFENEFLIWVSIIESDGKQFPNCLMQYNRNTRLVTESLPQISRKEAMLRGLYLCSQRIVRPSNVYVITDTELFTNISDREYRFFQSVAREFVKHKCKIVEVLLEKGHEVIDEHIKENQ